jgi:hypothetical protein
MNQWNKTLKTNPKYNQGRILIENLTNPKKCKNEGFIVYRSSLERKFISYLDNNSNVEWYLCEGTKIPYFLAEDNKVHNYYVDFTVKIGDKIFLIEIKPLKQTMIPKNKRSYKQMKTFLRNSSKWKAAQKYCENNGYIFKIITDEDMK